MASKKTTRDGLDFDQDLDDLSFGDMSFGEPRDKNEKKRKPITKIAFAAGRGALGSVTSENTIRNVIAKSLPTGYSTTVEVAYDARDGARELYHTAADEWRKMEPAARQLVSKITPRSGRFLPKSLQKKLENFAKGDGPGYTPENADESTIRRVLGELEGISEGARQQDKAESQTREAIRGQMEDKRHRSSLRMLGSIDARMAQMNAFNDQAFARYQKRSLEIQYRSFFVQRDLLRTQMAAAEDARQAYRALIHNTSLPDVDKLNMSDRIRQGVRKGARGAFDMGVNTFLGNYFGEAKKRMTSHVKGIMGGMGNAVSMGNMGMESAQMARQFGMDPSTPISEEIGAGIMNALLGKVGATFGSGMRRSGATAQKGAFLHRTISNLPGKVSKWAGKYDDTLLGQLLNPLKDMLGGKYQLDKSIGKSAMAEAGDTGTFTRRFQRSVEEVMPEYLSRILHELQITRKGPGAKRLVYNEDQNRFTSKKTRDKDIHHGLTETPQAQFGKDQVAEFANHMLGGKKVSDETYKAFQREIAFRNMHGEDLNEAAFYRKGTFLNDKQSRELRKALHGRHKGNLASGQDQTIRMQSDQLWRGLRSQIQNPAPYLKSMHDMGYTQSLVKSGMLKRQGDNYSYDPKAFVTSQFGHGNERFREHSRTVSEDLGGGPDWQRQFNDKPVNLFKAPNGQGQPVVEKNKVRGGKYTSIATGQTVHYMHDVAGGLTENGRLVVTAQDVLKLYTPNGTTFAQWLNDTPAPHGDGFLRKPQEWIEGHLRKAGQKTDALIDRLSKHPGARRFATPSGRAAAAASAHASMQDAVNRVTDHPNVQQAVKTAKRSALELMARLRQGWRHVISAAQYGQSLYESGGAEAVIEETKLRAGEYYSAKTGKPINDLRDIVEGVKSKTKQWVVRPEEVASLQTKAGENFKTLMDNLQSAVEKAKEQVKSANTAEDGSPIIGVVGVGKESASRQRTAAAASASSASARDAESQRAVYSAGSSDTMESLLKELSDFKQGNLEHLSHILDIISERDFTQPGGTPMGSGEMKGKGSLRDRLRKFRAKHLGTVISGGITAAGKSIKGGARLYGSYLKHATGFIGSALKLPFKLARLPFKGDPQHLGKEPSDVFVDNERMPRLTAGGMRAGAYTWIDPKTKKPGGLVRSPRDIKGEVKSTNDPSQTLISLDDLEHHNVTDRKGFSFARRTLGFLGRLAGTVGNTYLKVFSLPFRAVALVGRMFSGINNAFKQPVDIYVKGDTPWEPRVTAMGMRRGIYACKGAFGRMKKVRSINDIDGDVFDITKNPPEIKLSQEDFSKGLCDINGKRVAPKSGLFSRIGAGIIGGAASAIGGFARLMGTAVKTGASVAALPFKFLQSLLSGEGLINFRLFGGKGGKAGKTSDEKTHDLLSEILHMLDGRLPETEHYARGSWQQKLADRKKAAKAAGGKGMLGRAKDGIGSMWGKLKGLFGKKKKKDGEEGDDNGSMMGDASNAWNDIKSAKGAWGKTKAIGKGIWNVGGRAAKGIGRFFGKGGGVSALGEGAVAAEGAAGVAGAAGTAATVAGGAAAVGEGAALAGGAAVAGEAAVAAGGTIAAILSAPVLITAGIVAAVALAGYGLYKLGSKIHDLKKDEPFRRYRLIQYGFDIKDAIWKAQDVLKLEAMLLPLAHVAGSKVTFDPKAIAKLDKDDEFNKLFGLKKAWYNPMGWFHKKNVEDLKREQDLKLWLQGRFRPIFAHWISALQQVDKGVGLMDIDEKLKPEQKSVLLKKVHDFPKTALQYTTSPFADYPTLNGKPLETALDGAYSDCLKTAGTDGKGKGKGDGKDKGKTVKAAAAAAAGVAGAAAAATAKSGHADNKAAKDGEAAKLTAATKVGAGLAGASVALNAKANYQSSFAFLGGKLSALKAVRYKTYGLTEFKPDRVKAVFILETAMLDILSYDGKGKASYSGDASFWFDNYASYFGTSGADIKAKTRWYSWFAKRFLPVLLQFATSVKQQNKNVDPRDADDFLNPVQLQEVGNQTRASNYVQGKDTVSVWTFTDSPFDDQPLNTDVKSTDEHMQVLKNDADKQVITAATAAAATKAAKDKPSTVTSQTGTTASGAMTPEAQRQVTAQAQAPKFKLPPGISPGSKAANDMASGGQSTNPVGMVVSQPGNGTGGDINKIPVPTGTGYEALRATLDAAAKMAGVDPTVLSTFAGIESRFDPNARAGTSSAAGLGQFLRDTWKSELAQHAATYGIDPSTPPTDPRAAALMLAEYIKGNGKYLKKVLGRDPTDTELYMAHFLGPGGAKQLLTMPKGAIPANSMPGPARANASIFLNKGGAPRDKDQVIAELNRRVTVWRDKVKKGGPATPAEMKAGQTSVASSSSSKASISPPGATPGPKGTNVSAAVASAATSSGGGSSSPDVVAAARSTAMSKSIAADRQAQATSSAGVQHTQAIAQHAATQTEYQRQMVDSLNKIANHTANTAQGLSALSQNGSASASTASASPDGTQSTGASSSAGSAQASAKLPPMPASMQRTVYSDANA